MVQLPIETEARAQPKWISDILRLCCYIETYLEEKSFVMVVSSTEKQKRRNHSVPVMNAVRLKS